MKFYFIVGLILLTSSLRAQVTNLHMNHGDSTFTMTSGDTLRWEYDVPVGASVSGELWFDRNGNGAIDPDSDALVIGFTQNDGDSAGVGGYPDLDGAANGHVVFSERAGFPHGSYVIRFMQNAATATGVGNVNALASPAHTVSGNVAPPAGKGAQNIFVMMDRSAGYGKIFWGALTDGSGNYSIAMNADTAGNPWHVRIGRNPFPPAFIFPAETLVTVSGNPTNVNFSIVNPAAIVRGFLTDDEGVPLNNAIVVLSRLASSSDSLSFSAKTDTTGWFLIPIMPGTLTGSSWKLQQKRSGQTTTTTMLAIGAISSIAQGDTIEHSLIAYRTNSTISGQVLVDGLPPDPSMLVFATSVDVAEAFGRTLAEGGEFSIAVTDKFTSYTIHVDPVFAEAYHVQDVTAAPGDNSIFISISTTPVNDPPPGMPNQFLLEQNYPNPFNPTTNFTFSIPAFPLEGRSAGFVSLKVFDLLGRDVSTVVSGELTPGTYTRIWDASGLPSGMYYYRLSYGSQSSFKKMILMR